MSIVSALSRRLNLVERYAFGIKFPNAASNRLFSTQTKETSVTGDTEQSGHASDNKNETSDQVRQQQQRRGRDFHNQSVFIRNIPYSVGENEAYLLFSKAGPVKRFSFGRTRDNYDAHPGWGFCVYEQKQSADKALEMFDGYEIRGRKIEVKARSEPSEPHSK